jgi:hypothetical protein
MALLLLSSINHGKCVYDPFVFSSFRCQIYSFCSFSSIFILLLLSRCGTSARLQPSIKKLAATFKSQIHFARVNVYANSAVAQRFQLRAYPVFAVFTQRGVHVFWLTKKLSANSLFNLITRVAKAPDWVSRPFRKCCPSLLASGPFFVIFASDCRLRRRCRCHMRSKSWAGPATRRCSVWHG